MLERFQLLRNIGQYDSVNAGAQIPLSTLTLIYGENGRGKTTLSSVLRSLGTGDADLVLERHRLGAANPPHVVLGFAGGVTAQFQHGAWSAPMPRIAIFDDAFVAANVCSGVEIGTGHRQNLHELILGAQGVALNAALQVHVARIEEHNRALTLKGNAIPAAARGGLNVDNFCALPADPDIEASVAMGALLARTLPDLEADAAAQVRDHLRRLGKGGEGWVGDGMTRIAGASEGRDHEVCPFCAQNLDASPLIAHYQAYFGQAYDGLKSSITEAGQGIHITHGGDVPASFERAVRIVVQGRTFWNAFTDVPEVELGSGLIL
ncbi:AAA family ATPase [Acetobacter thailandicus]|uniref:AAA family ATPase n=1 Tax=Acetobacter thailandicus TaxID=1502842 RepID=UPI001BAA6D3B|nr:hypothetical protein [Acetobacter thailandicus]MBS0987005.1 hypothetical protein [Acetobacter thailandicus]